MVDTGTGYNVSTIVPNRSTTTIIDTIERHWICQRGAPEAISADDEFNIESLLKIPLSP